MKCKYLKDGICEKLSDDEVKQPCVEGPCEFDTTVSELKNCPFCGGKAHLEDLGFPHHIYCEECGARVTSLKYSEEGEAECTEKWNTRTASPRFTEVEREAMDRVAYHAEADLENRWIKSSQIYKEDTTAIATVRKMLEGSV